MDTMKALFILLVFSVQWGLVSTVYTASDAATLLSDLTTAYSSDVRPDENTFVQLEFGMMHITELNIVSQSLTMVGFLLVTWQDTRLVWTSASYNNIASTTISFSSIWTPPLLLNNAADGLQFVNDNSDVASVPAKLANDGSVHWLVPVTFISQCSVDIAFYPFDIQTCSFVVSTWVFDTSEVSVFTITDSINFDMYEENGEWDILSTSTENTTSSLYGFDVSAVTFTVKLERKYSYYIKNLILPVIFIGLLGPFVFLLPVESGEKNGFSLTILLSLSVVMTTVSDHIPPTATSVCIISVFLLTTLIVCVVETLVTVMTCRIHDFHSKGYKPSPRSQAFMRFCAKLTFYRRADAEDDANSTNKNNNTQKETLGLGLKQLTNDKAWEEEEEGNADNGINDYTYEEVATVIDRFSFVVFFLVTAVVTLGFMVYLSTGTS